MQFHEKQENFINSLVSEVKNSPLSKKPVFLPVSSSPGSGKTTVLVESARRMSEYLSQRIEYQGDTNVPIKQILVLLFDKKMKNEIEKRINKHPEINEDLFEVTNIHSLFFRELKDFQKKQQNKESFELDFSKGFFTKKMIEWYLKSLVTTEPALSDKIDLKIDMFRFFDTTELINKKNIEILWAVANTYFASPYTLKMIQNIQEDAKFFLKDEVSLEDLTIPEVDQKKLLKLVAGKNIQDSPGEILFKLLVKRINQLAITKERIIHKEKKVHSFDVEFVDANGKVSTQRKTNERIEEHAEYLDNIVKVPHCFYYKSFYTGILKDENFAKKVFGNYKAVLVDEAQDNDRMFFQIIVHLARSNIIKNFAFVGDPDQSIYGFKSPDHFDMLTYMNKHQEEIKSMNIEYKPHLMDITFRFGSQIANFVNSLFGSKIQGLSNNKNFIYPEEVKNEKLHVLVNNISKMKDKTAAIICRSNAEAMRLFVDLKTKGCDNVVLHSSSKDELKDFSKKGSAVISNEKTKAKLMEILARTYGEREIYTYEDILSNHEAISYLFNNGYSHLVRFSKEEISNYIIPPNRKRKDICWIGTAHLFKGMEFDYTITAGDFFKKPERANVQEIMNNFKSETKKEESYSSNDSVMDFARSFFGKEKKEPSQTTAIDNKIKDIAIKAKRKAQDISIKMGFPDYIEDVYLVGSRAKGTNRPTSDIDFLIKTKQYADLDKSSRATYVDEVIEKEFEKLTQKMILENNDVKVDYFVTDEFFNNNVVKIEDNMQPSIGQENSNYVNTTSTALREQLCNPDNHEERCIYYVALTRATEGVFFTETPYWNEIANHIDNNFDVAKEYSYLLEEKKENSQEFDFASMMLEGINKEENEEVPQGLFSSM